MRSSMNQVSCEGAWTLVKDAKPSMRNTKVHLNWTRLINPNALTWYQWSLKYVKFHRTKMCDPQYAIIIWCKGSKTHVLFQEKELTDYNSNDKPKHALNIRMKKHHCLKCSKPEKLIGHSSANPIKSHKIKNEYASCPTNNQTMGRRYRALKPKCPLCLCALEKPCIM